MVGAGIKIILEEQLVGPPIHIFVISSREVEFQIK